MKYVLVIVPLFVFVFYSQGQNTIGVVNYNPVLTQDGYNLVYPSTQGNVYLLNNCGEIVNVWRDSVYNPGASVYFGDDGYLYVTKSRGLASNPQMNSGGGGERIEKRDWNNNLLWHYTYNNANVRMHHDVCVMPNGNVLILAWERVSGAEAIANGRDTTLLSDGELWPDHVIEVQPIGLDSGAIVWEWHAWDHIVQQFDPSKLNFGIISISPGRIDVNYGTQGSSRADWLHTNAIDYNETLDQIILSVPNFDEVWIIDHSTTTAEAATASGGLSGRGGRLMYRWGNPLAYKNGGNPNHILGFQHNSHWLKLGLGPNNPDRGKIGIFNNWATFNTSEVIVLDPVFDVNTWSYPMNGNIWGPIANYWSYVAPIPQNMFSTGLSGMQRLDNGNTLICLGRPGRIFEITPTGNEVWRYIIPLSHGFPASQGDTIANDPNSIVNSIFTMNRYPATHPALIGRNLQGNGFIELNPDTNFCSNVIGIDEPSDNNSLSLFPVPTTEQLHITSEKALGMVELFDIYGKLLFSSDRKKATNYVLHTGHFAPGIYVIRIGQQQMRRIIISD